MAQYKNTHGLAKGFTLLELTIWISILGIGFLLLVTQLSINRSRGSKYICKRIADQFETLGTRSLISEQKISLFLKRDGGFLLINTDDKTIGRFPLSASTEIIGISATKPVIFYPSGATTPLSIDINQGQASCTLSLSLRGRAQCRC